LYAKARASRHVLGLYASWAIERLRERSRGRAARGLVRLAEAVAARTGRSEAQVMTVLVEAQSAGEAAAPSSFRSPASAEPREASARDFEVLRELLEFLAVTESGGPHRGGQVPSDVVGSARSGRE